MPSPRRIDVHFHLIPQFYKDAVYAAGSGPAIGRYPDWSEALALEIMERFGIATALVSLAQPGVQFCKPDEARAPVWMADSDINHIHRGEMTRHLAANMLNEGLM